MFKKTNSKILIILISGILFFMLGTATYAWFVLINRTDAFIITAAKVDATYSINLEGSSDQLDFFTFTDTTSVTKSGVYFIDVADINATNFITNVRIDIKINSTIDTYIRVKIIDSLTLSTIDFEGNHGEVAIVEQPINYAIARQWDVNGIIYDDLLTASDALGGITANDVVTILDDWYDNRAIDGFIYYPNLIQRDINSPELTISFIEEFDGDSFDTKSIGYSLQFAIIVEAVQAGNNAPVFNWGLSNPPWGGAW